MIVEYTILVNILLIGLGKLLSFFSKVFNLGHGSTWPGHIALNINKDFIKHLLRKNPHLKIILIAGTNGKTTTGKLIRSILENNGIRVIHNEEGANLLNGIASALIKDVQIIGKLTGDIAIFEIDENTLPLIADELTPDYVVLLNLFRDQLDRYGEVNTIARKWKEAIQKLSSKTTLILNADDPQIAFIGKHGHRDVQYFGLDDDTVGQKKYQHAVDSTYCLNCGNKLSYKIVYFSHLGDWECNNCKEKRPKLTLSRALNYPLAGVYNRYNTLAAVLLAKANNISNETIEQSLKSFSPAFGRQEKLSVNGKSVQLFLSKNPTSFNESLRTIREYGAKNILLVLNDRIPDGRDVSWIWDVDFEEVIDSRRSISVAGDRVYDMALRLKYGDISLKEHQTYTDLKSAISENLKIIKKNKTLYILPTYSAMLEVRKILTGKKIL